VQISTDNGATWKELASYTGGIPVGQSALAVDPEWTDVHWKNVEIDLSTYTGMVRLRFGLEVDQWGPEKGWVIDDVMVQSGSPKHTIFLPLVLKGQ
jgi:hypothetical protein